MTTSFLDVRKDTKANSLTIPPLLIVCSDSHFRNEINKHKDPDGIRVFHPEPQISVHEDRRTDIFTEDVMCVDN